MSTSRVVRLEPYSYRPETTYNAGEQEERTGELEQWLVTGATNLSKRGKKAAAVLDGRLTPILPLETEMYCCKLE